MVVEAVAARGRGPGQVLGRARERVPGPELELGPEQAQAPEQALAPELAPERVPAPERARVREPAPRLNGVTSSW